MLIFIFIILILNVCGNKNENELVDEINRLKNEIDYLKNNTVEKPKCTAGIDCLLTEIHDDFKECNSKICYAFATIKAIFLVIFAILIGIIVFAVQAFVDYIRYPHH